MKKRIVLLLLAAIPVWLFSQAVIIDHSNIHINHIPDQWIETAKSDLFIGYGHTSHGSQLTSGMNALEAYHTDGKFDWSHTGGAGELHLFEGAGYGTGYLELDCGYAGWDDQTRTYLDDHPDCNVIIWSWCGQVNSVDLQTHYLVPMSQLETDYPGVQFVYMTGHLEGLGPSGSLFQANQQIRDYCNANNKILFDFADIEKYSPDSDTNFMDYYANDACDYQHPAGGTANWANDWLNSNPGHGLTDISALCSSCAHSVSLNCVKKGIACWYLWARLAGWDGQSTGIGEKLVENIKIYPNPVNDVVRIKFQEKQEGVQISVQHASGALMKKKYINAIDSEFELNISDIASGLYILTIETKTFQISRKIVKR